MTDELSGTDANGPEEAGEVRERENKGSDDQPWGPREQRYADTAEQGGQPNLGPAPPPHDDAGGRRE
jgi:hypothetical protein